MRTVIMISAQQAFDIIWWCRAFYWKWFSSIILQINQQQNKSDINDKCTHLSDLSRYRQLQLRRWMSNIFAGYTHAIQYLIWKLNITRHFIINLKNANSLPTTCTSTQQAKEREKKTKIKIFKTWNMCRMPSTDCQMREKN